MSRNEEILQNHQRIQVLSLSIQVNTRHFQANLEETHPMVRAVYVPITRHFELAVLTRPHQEVMELHVEVIGSIRLEESEVQ